MALVRGVLHFSLKMLNLVIGLTKADARLSPVVAELGYEVLSIERSFAKSKQQLVHPEVLLFSAEQRHSLLIECKDGGNIDLPQAERYSRVIAADLQARAFVSQDASSAHDVLYIVPDDCAA